MAEQLSFLPNKEPQRNKPKERNLSSLIKRLLSKGPLFKNPVFHDGPKGTGEIMTIEKGNKNNTVQVYYEDVDEPGKLQSEEVNALDVRAEIELQNKKKRKK